ncbi:FAD-dependent oxidoreductase [Crenobacter sp. SG2303]|uniref:FAD-dependent oxidoreductase n=1 Tax=Crenobacter oryzisoli TaxID=3056844 RepID=A0ABT7XK51_9NEIS|nr:FAD-dependent oxidoreductase [Crenobacter sp. SG2303]MDN0074163.1 FAD-dependent oxidoreductase [Crenobacter sp. SG2303]
MSRPSETVPEHVEIAVVGGGPVGALTALRLARAGRRVALIEARDPEAKLTDARAIALSWASLVAFADAGVQIPYAALTAIDTVHVSQQGSWGRTVLSRDDLDLPQLGAVVDYPALAEACQAALAAAGVAVLWRTRVTRVATLAAFARLTLSRDGAATPLTCRLAVLADGGELAEQLPGVTRRVHDYHQSALLAELRTERPHGGVAYERFSARGPLALLPHGEAFKLVWTRSPTEAEALRDEPSEQLIEQLDEALAGRFGKVLAVSGRAVFPLTLKQVNRTVSGRVALIGNAAQTMHPVAAQGLNLGVRDALGLVEAVAASADPGEAGVLRRYAGLRRLDSQAVVGFTHGLVSLFDGNGALMSLLRGAGMNLLDLLPPARRRFAGHLVFGVGTAR